MNSKKSNRIKSYYKKNKTQLINFRNKFQKTIRNKLNFKLK